jgi:sugar phosphate isomerase/epimerase
VRELLLEADLSYTAHAPLEVNLMDLTVLDLQRNGLRASIRFANDIGAGMVVCHAGQRAGPRDPRYSLKD